MPSDETPKFSGPHRRFIPSCVHHPLTIPAGFALLLIVIGALAWVAFGAHY